MGMVKWILGGLVGGGIGALIWVVVGYASGYEIGWIAWGVGFLAGAGVRAAAGETNGYGPGIAAASVAIGSVLVAKYLVVFFLVQNAMAEVSQPEPTSNSAVISSIADEIAEEHEEAGQKVTWPALTQENAPTEAFYPKEIWEEASTRWNEMTPEQQQDKRETYEREMAEFIDNLNSEIRGSTFRESFSPWDLLWFGLATFTAFKLGSGAAENE